MRRCHSGKLNRYEDLPARSRARWREPVDELADDIAPLRDGDKARPAGIDERIRRHPHSPFDQLLQ